jgi:hypothetical protein
MNFRMLCCADLDLLDELDLRCMLSGHEEGALDFHLRHFTACYIRDGFSCYCKAAYTSVTSHGTYDQHFA